MHLLFDQLGNKVFEQRNTCDVHRKMQLKTIPFTQKYAIHYAESEAECQRLLSVSSLSTHYNSSYSSFFSYLALFLAQICIQFLCKLLRNIIWHELTHSAMWCVYQYSCVFLLVVMFATIVHMNHVIANVQFNSITKTIIFHWN